MSEIPATSSADALGLASQSYEEFLEDIKGHIHSAQARAARAINAELIEVYRQIGREIVRRQAEEGDRRGRGGPKVIERLSADLRAAFPGARGYSVSSLRYMRAFAVAWPEQEMLQSGVGALPWGHVVLLLDRLADRPTRDWYAARADSWSRAQLETAIVSRLHEREGASRRQPKGRESGGCQCLGECVEADDDVLRDRDPPDRGPALFFEEVMNTQAISFEQWRRGAPLHINRCECRAGCCRSRRRRGTAGERGKRAR